MLGDSQLDARMLAKAVKAERVAKVLDEWEAEQKR